MLAFCYDKALTDVILTSYLKTDKVFFNINYVINTTLSAVGIVVNYQLPA